MTSPPPHWRAEESAQAFPAGTGALPPLGPRDVPLLAGAADPRLSPDGRTVAFVRWRVDEAANRSRSAVWVVPADGSAPARPFTAGDRDSAPRWSPDGRTLAFTSSRGEGDRANLYVMPADGGEARRVTDHPGDVEDPVWSPDGARMAFTARDPDPDDEEDDERRRRPRRIRRLVFEVDDVGWIHRRPRHVFVAEVGAPPAPDRPLPPAPAKGGEKAPDRPEALRLTDGDMDHDSPAWSPDGKWIAFTADRREDWDLDDVVDVYLVPSAGGEPRRLTASDGRHAEPAWSPDGTRIAVAAVPYVRDEPRHAQIAVLDAASGERTILTASLDRNCMPYPPVRGPLWDGGELVFSIEQRGDVHVYRVPADGSGAPAPAIEGDHVVTGLDLAAGTVVHVSNSTSAPSVLRNGERTLFDASAALTSARTLVEPERFTAASPDGSEVDAWIIRPPGVDPDEPRPTLLAIHGGPFTQFGSRFVDELQMLAGAGYVVLYSNPRGSSGSTEAWGRAIAGPALGGTGWGSVDHDDLMAVVDEAVRRFQCVDGDRLGVLGGSYGGYMTTWIVSHSDRFKAAISERSVNDLVELWGASDYGPSFGDHFGATPWSDPDLYRRTSASTYADRITTPLLIVHSERDLRCPIAQAVDLFRILRTLRREVELVRFPAEGHELSRSGSPAHRIMRMELIVEFLSTHLPAAAPAA